MFGLELEYNFMMMDSFDHDVLPTYLEDMIDKAIGQDFVEVLHLTPADHEAEVYKAIMYSFLSAHVEILYERIVRSTDKESRVIPYEQYLFGFRPTEGLCILTQKKQHKAMLCDGPIRELAKQCPLTQSLQYVLVPKNQFRVWSYIPICCSDDDTCALKSRPLSIRRDLFQD